MKKLDLKLGYSCNNNCLHCVIADFRDAVLKKGLPQDLTSQEYLTEIIAARNLGFELLVFTGGEPTIRPDLPLLLEKARKLGFLIQMQTNGRKFADRQFARKISSLAPISYCIALHSFNPQIHDQITQRSGSFEETVAGIKNLLSLKQKTTVKIVISRLNSPALKETAEFILNLGISHLSLTFPHACGNAGKYFYEVVPRYSEILPPLKAAIKTVIARGKTLDTEAIPFCCLEEFPHLVGEVFLAREPEVYLQQYGDTVKERNWNQERKAFKRKFPQCRECRFDLICEGPWREYPEKYGDSEFVPLLGEKIRHPDRLFSPPLILEELPLNISCP